MNIHFYILYFIQTLMLLSSSVSIGAEPKKTLTLKVPSATELTTSVYELPNGLTVALTPNERAPLVSIYHWVKAGSLHETPGITGIAHLFEHMMFRPLEPNSLDFFSQLKRWGADANANTRYMATVYTTTVPPQNLIEVLKLEADRFKKLKVTDELLNVERKAVWSEYSTKFDNSPILDLWYALYQGAFPKHPYGWTVIGFREDLEKIKAEDCNQFFNKYYRPNNVGLFISGSFQAGQVLQKIQELYGDWSPGKATSWPSEFKPKAEKIQTAGRLPAKARNLLVGYRIPNPDGENHYLHSFVNYVFYESNHSLARQRLVHKLKMASSVSDFNFDYDSGMIKAFTSLLPGVSLETGLQALGELVNDLKNLSEAEYQAFVQNYRLNSLESLQRNESLNENLAFFWGKQGNLASIQKLFSPEFQISKKEVVKFAETYIRPENMVVTTNKDFQ